MKTYNILIDIDCLLDTRIPIAMGIDKSAVEKVTGAGYEWWRRPHDFFDNENSPIHIPGYKEAWDNRDVSVLPDSLLTNLVFFLKEMTEELKSAQFGKGSLDKIDYDNIRLDINMYPYKELSKEERDSICEAVKYYCAVGTLVTHCYKPHNQITPAMLGDNYKAYFVYEFGNWFHNYHEEVITTIRPYPVSIYAPDIAYDNVNVSDIDDIDEELRKHKINPHSTLKLALSMFIFYEPLPIMLFSMFNVNLVTQFQKEMDDIKEEIHQRRVDQSSSSSSSSPSGENSS